jgi:hypothetical protein
MGPGRNFTLLVLAVSLGAVSAATPVNRSTPLPPGVADSRDRLSDDAGARTGRLFAHVPLTFVRNQGQLDSRVDYYVQGADTTLYFNEQGMTLVRVASRRAATIGPGGTTPAVGPRSELMARSRWVVQQRFIGAERPVRPIGQNRARTVVSYFTGSKAQWKTGVPTYSELRYPDLWPGIDVVYSSLGGGLEYRFVVDPGADPAHIRLAYRGTTGVGLDPSGRLRIETPLGGFVDGAPL